MRAKSLLLFAVLGLKAFCQLPNPDFETWTEVGGSPFPSGWHGSPFGVDTTTDATQGSNALMIWTWYNYSPGFVYNGGHVISSNQYDRGGTPYTQKPLSLSGMYKFDTTNVATKDSVMVLVFLKRYNTMTHFRDTVAFGKSMLPAASSYIPFSVPVYDLMPGTDPDSIIVLISTQRRAWDFSNATNTCSAPFMDCAYAWFDDLHLNTAAGTTELTTLFSPVAYPNPAKEYISFNYKSMPDPAYEHITVYDNTGSICYSGRINSTANKLKVKHFGKGIYHYVIISDDKTIFSKGKFVVID